MDILGVDLAHNGRITSNGDLAIVSGPDNVRQAVTRRLNTPRGSLFAHPTYGNPVYDMLSEPITESWIGRAISCIQECLSDEPRIILINISTQVIPESRNVCFTVSYQLVNDSEVENITWEAAA